MKRNCWVFVHYVAFKYKWWQWICWSQVLFIWTPWYLSLFVNLSCRMSLFHVLWEVFCFLDIDIFAESLVIYMFCLDSVFLYTDDDIQCLPFIMDHFTFYHFVSYWLLLVFNLTCFMMFLWNVDELCYFSVVFSSCYNLMYYILLYL